MRTNLNNSPEKMSLLKSTAINQGHHIGLQQLQAISASGHVFLGPNKRYKLIQDEANGQAALVSSCYRLLEQLEVEGSVAQLLLETIRGHWKVLRAGTTSLVFLAGVWSRVALECLHKGIAIPHIVTSMSKGLDVCVEACRARAVSVEAVCKVAFEKSRLSSTDGMSSEDGSGVRKSPHDSVKTLNKALKHCSLKYQYPLKHRISLKHSRHFNSRDDTEATGTCSLETSHTSSSKGFDVEYLAKTISHGCEMAMNLVIEASKIQSKYSHNVLDIDKLVTCPLPGLSEGNSCVIYGYVVLLPAELLLLVKRLEDRTLNISLVNGELSEKHRHIGFNRPKNVTCYSNDSDLRGMSREQDWIDTTLRALLNLKVDIVFVSGGVTEQLKDHCLSHHILVVEHVKLSILSDFARTTGALPVSYVTQLSEQCLGSGVRVIMLRDYHGEGKTELIVVNIVTDGSCLVTALITSLVHAKLQSLEDQFWKCVYRVHHALKDGKLLPGAGAAELLCIHALQKHINKPQLEERGDTNMASVRSAAAYELVVLQMMAEGWMDYVSTLMMNAGQVETKAQAWTCIAQRIKDWENKRTPGIESPEGLLNVENYSDVVMGKTSEKWDMAGRELQTVAVYDNVTVKFEAWRRALDVVVLVLLTDTEIITGVNNTDIKYKDSIIL